MNGEKLKCDGIVVKSTVKMIDIGIQHEQNPTHQMYLKSLQTTVEHCKPSTEV